MSWEATAWAKKQRTGSPARKAVLLVIADYASHEGEAWPGRELIADDTEQSVDSVDRHLRALEEMGLLTVERKRENGRQAPNVYRLNIDLDAAHKHLRGNRFRPKTEPQIAARSPEPQSPEPQPISGPQTEPQTGPQTGPQLCGPNKEPLEPKNLLPNPSNGRTKIFFDPSKRGALLEAVCQAIGAGPSSIPEIG